MCKDNHASRWIRLGLHSFHLPRHLAPLVAKPWMWVHYACCPNTKHLLNPRPSLPTIAFESLIKVSLYANYLKDLHFDIASQKILLEIKSWRMKKICSRYRLFCSVGISSIIMNKLTKITKYILFWLSEL